MNLPIEKQKIVEVYRCIKSCQYKCGCVDILERTDGMFRGGVLVIYELPD